MAVYGRNDSSNPDFGYSNNSEPNTKVTVFKKMEENGWAYELGGRFCVADVDPGTCKVRMEIGTVDRDLVPDQRMGYSNTVTVTDEGSDQTDTSPFTASLASVDISYGSTNGIMLWNNKYYYMGHTVDPSGAMLLFAMRQAALLNYPNEVMYTRNLASAIPPDPFNHSGASIEGILTQWANYEPNVKPNTPTSLSPTGNVNSLTPTFTSDFVDSNEDRGDKILRYNMELREGSTTGTLKWNSTYNASSAEQSASATSRAYGGSTLSNGVTYYWRITHYDMFGEASTPSPWQSITVNSGGVVINQTSPTGKQETLSPTPFVAQWDHASGLSTQSVKVQIRDVAGNPIATSDYIAKVVADLGTISISWGDTAFPAGTLAWGQSYTAHILAKDSLGLDSAYSDGIAFTTNTSPTQPTNLYPTNNLPVSDYPLLQGVATDSDDTVGTGLVGYARIKDIRVPQNPDFEVDNSKWNLDAQSATWTVQTLTRDTSIKRSGAASGRFNVTPPASNPQTLKWKATDSGGTNPDKIPVVVGQNYMVHGWIRSSLASMGVAMYIDFYTAADVFISGVVGNEILSNDSNFYESIVSGIAPATASYYRYGIRFRNTVNSTPNTVYLDDVSHDLGVRYERAMTLNTTLNKWEYQTTSTDLPAFKNYRWDMYLYDGTLTGPVSIEAPFIFGQGPTVTLDAPADGSTVTSNNPSYEWTTTDQAKFRLMVYRADNDALVYDSLWVVGDVSRSMSHGSGYLYNNTQYYAIIGIEDSLTLVGYSAANYFTVDYPDPPALNNFQVNGVPINTDTVPTANAISWTKPNLPPANFKEYVIKRTNVSTNETIIQQRIQNQDVEIWYDYFPQFGVTFEYTVFYTTYTGSNEELDSIASVDQSILNGRYPVFNDVTAGGTYHVVCEILDNFSWEDKDDTTFELTWGEEGPTAIVGSVEYEVAVGTFSLITDRFGTAKDKLDSLRALKKRKSIVCYRDTRQTYIIGYMGLKVKYAAIDAYEVEVSLQAVSYRQGVD
jgi:hypothetical protein